MCFLPACDRCPVPIRPVRVCSRADTRRCAVLQALRRFRMADIRGMWYDLLLFGPRPPPELSGSDTSGRSVTGAVVRCATQADRGRLCRDSMCGNDIGSAGGILPLATGLRGCTNRA